MDDDLSGRNLDFFGGSHDKQKKHVFFGNQICDLLVLGSQKELEDPSTALRCGMSLEVVSGLTGGPELSRVTNDR